jgi:hypothetical protein
MSEIKTTVNEAAAVIWQAAKETPRQMVAPYVAAWRELVKNIEPSESQSGSRTKRQHIPHY